VRFLRHFVAALGVLSATLAAQQPAQPSSAPSVPAALTIYNENFAVARVTIQLDLHPGLNEVSTDQVTSQLEPDSVVLRDLATPAQGKPTFHILEQNYDAGIVTQDVLLKKYEGQTIKFLQGQYQTVDGKVQAPPFVEGKIIRAPQPPGPYGNPNGVYQQNQPLIQVGDQMLFQLPGSPVFPSVTDGLLLKPTLRWQIDAEKTQKLSTELAYITSGMNWEATYNVIVGNVGAAPGKAPATAATAEEKAGLLGWVTITNYTGVDFPQARIKLMAGDVAKLSPRPPNQPRPVQISMAANVAVDSGVTQKAFDDYHLYDLNRVVSLHDGETKQVQFLEVPSLAVARSYVYDGSDQQRQAAIYYGGQFIQQQNYGLGSNNTKVQIVEEIKNSEANHLGIPLPAGRVRLYRRDDDGQVEFVGESTINHTPAEDTIHITSGNAFDIKGSRRQTNFNIDNSRRTLEEHFEIKLTNQKDVPVTVNVLEHLYRGDNWDIIEKSADYTKLDSHTIRFPVQVPAKGDATVSYAVRYTW